MEKHTFFIEAKCWAPRASWLGTFWLLVIFLRPQPWPVTSRAHQAYSVIAGFMGYGP